MVVTDFLVRRDRLTDHALHVAPFAELSSGTVEMAIDRFGLTANNVTYGALGDSLGYWRFFPTTEAGWGRLPVWGFGTVTRSAVADVSPGERFFGYFPMSSHVVVEPRRTSPLGFLDGAPHRRGLSPVYNQYLRTTTDALYDARTERHQAVLRPLLATAYFIADFLDEHGCFGAHDVAISSASSKLACATAMALCERAGRKGEIIGLTSARNTGFVRELRFYDRVVAYDDVPQMSTARRTAYLDMAGSRDVRAAVHRRFAAQLMYSSAIGATHWTALAHDEVLPGPRPVAFFTPDWIGQRTKAWGAAGVQARLADSWAKLLAAIAEHPWIALVEAKGPDAVARSYDAVVGGTARPGEAYVCRLGGSDV